MQSTMVRAVVVMSAMAFLAIAALAIFQPGDHVAMGHILTIAVPTTAALLGLLRSTANGRALNGLNAGRVDDARTAGHAAGVADERQRTEGRHAND
jgi:hypothetical protein